MERTMNRLTKSILSRLDGPKKIVLLKDGILTIVFPIHVTHISDMDGLGCAILSGLVSILHAEIITPFIIPVGNNDIYSSINSRCITKLTEEFFHEIENEIKLIHGEVKEVKFITWFIVTDIATHSNDVKNSVNDFKSRMSKLGIEYRIWLIDHHTSNGYSLEVIQNDTSTFCINFSKYVDVCAKNFNIKDVTQLGYGYSHSHSLSGNPHLNDLLFDKRDKSAMFIYFIILIEEGLIRFDKVCGETKIMLQMMKFVYMISCGDTYAFDFYDEKALWCPKYPRAYNSYFKFKNAGSNVSTFADFTNKFLSEINYSLLDNYVEAFSKDDFPDTKYGPFFTTDDIRELDIVYEDEKQKYKNAVYHAKYMEVDKHFEFVSEVLSVGSLKMKNWSTNCLYDFLLLFQNNEICCQNEIHRYAVFIVENGEDVSMIGNTILKQTDGLDIALFLYPESRTLSFRANNLKTVKVDSVASRLGGGGHPFASGAKLIENDFIELLKLYWILPPLGTQTSIMEDICKGISTM